MASISTTSPNSPPVPSSGISACWNQTGFLTGFLNAIRVRLIGVDAFFMLRFLDDNRWVSSLVHCADLAAKLVYLLLCAESLLQEGLASLG